MLGLALVWISQLPFQLLELWWLRRYGLWEAGYLDWFIENWLVLAAEFLFICLWLLITMGFAAIFEALVARGDTGLRRDRFALRVRLSVSRADRGGTGSASCATRTHAGRQGTEPIKVVVEEASEYTTIPNAYAAGLGPSRRIVLLGHAARRALRGR